MGGVRGSLARNFYRYCPTDLSEQMCRWHKIAYEKSPFTVVQRKADTYLYVPVENGLRLRMN